MGWCLRGRLGERGRTFSESPHVSVYACCGSLFQDPISAPSWIPCSSLTAQDPAWPTTDKAQGQQAAHLHPNGTWRPPLLSPLGSLPSSPFFIFSDPKGHPRAQLKLEASGVYEKSPALVRRCPQGLGASHPRPARFSEKGPGTSYSPSQEACGFPHYHMNGAQAPGPLQQTIWLAN